MDKTAVSVKKVGDALDRLKEMLEETPDAKGAVLDSTIQRFEFVIELYWKMLKNILEEEGFVIASPRQAFQRAYQSEWIEEEQVWLNMLRDRNLTSHTYDKTLAQEIYQNIKDYYPVLEHTYKKLITL